VIAENQTRLVALYNSVKKLRPVIDEFKGVTTPLKIHHITAVPLLASLPYLTGLAEGDGNFSVDTNGTGFRVRAEVTQQDRYILFQYMKFFECGTVYSHQTNYRGRKADQSKWTVFHDDAVQYMNKILPYVVSNAVRQQIRLILDGGATKTVQDELKQFKACTLRMCENART
jgi:LAGLIDADG endonuclease